MNMIKIRVSLLLTLLILLGGFYSIRESCEIQSFDEICDTATDAISLYTPIHMEIITTTVDLQNSIQLLRNDFGLKPVKTISFSLLALLTVLISLSILNHSNSMQFSRSTLLIPKIRQCILFFIHEKDGKK